MSSTMIASRLLQIESLTLPRSVEGIYMNEIQDKRGIVPVQGDRT